jgi:hypothetical protein
MSPGLFNPDRTLRGSELTWVMQSNSLCEVPPKFVSMWSPVAWKIGRRCPKTSLQFRLDSRSASWSTNSLPQASPIQRRHISLVSQAREKQPLIIKCTKDSQKKSKVRSVALVNTSFARRALSEFLAVWLVTVLYLKWIASSLCLSPSHTIISVRTLISQAISYLDTEWTCGWIVW